MFLNNVNAFLLLKFTLLNQAAVTEAFEENFQLRLNIEKLVHAMYKI